MGKELYTGALAVNALTSANITSDTTTNGAVIDLKGFSGCLFTIRGATRTDGTYTPLLEESDNSDMSASNAVLDEDMEPTEANAALAATGAIKTIAYRVGSKRYVRLSIVSTGVTTGMTAISATALLHNAEHSPVH